MSRSLLALSGKAKREPAHRFRGVGRLISLPMLHECYHSLSKVIGFEHEDDARACYARLPERLSKFGLTLAADKSGIVRFDRRGGRGNGRFA